MAKSLDDSQLLRLACDPRTRLFSPLRGATVFSPLVAVAGLVPVLAAFMAPELTDTSAACALRSLDVITAIEIQGWLEPGWNGFGNGFAFQPPLLSWLLATTVPYLGTGQLISWHAVSAALGACAVWAMFLLGRRLGGASFGLVATIIVCAHPRMLQLAATTGPAMLGMLLMTIAGWGFLSHLESPPLLVSLRMLAGSVAWGLALLTVGPVALVLFMPMLIQAWLLHEGLPVAERTGWTRLAQLWLGMRTLLLYLVTAMSFSGWWHMMMLGNHGRQFWNSWWTGLVTVNFPGETPSSFWQEWLSQNTFICGWLLLGLVSVARELRTPSSELVRRRCQFLLFWWLIVLLMRILFDTPGLRRSALIDAWDAHLLIPTALLAATGIRAFVMRQTRLAGEALLVLLPLGLAVWRTFQLPWLGLAAFVLGLGVVAILPVLTARIRGGARRWNERDWRRVLRTATVLIAVGQLATGLAAFPQRTTQSRSLSELRRRIGAVETVPRVTLLTSNGVAPESLLFVLRSRWPTSQFVIAASRGAKLARDGSVSIFPTELVVEWTQHDVRITNELSADRQATAVGDPLRYRGRRMMIYQISARQR